MDYKIVLKKFLFGFLTGAVSAVAGCSILAVTTSTSLNDVKMWLGFAALSFFVGGINGGFQALNNYFKHRNDGVQDQYPNTAL